ncbi:hypothetical protein C0J52_06732 [Blattella germanica]|nr:hypothetical protein C0J52_06732 [Blattella germanica]
MDWSAVTEHVLQQGHDGCFKELTLLSRITDYHQSLYREAIEILKLKSSFNRKDEA